MRSQMSRVEELLSAIQLEFNNVSQEVQSLTIQNQKDFELKLNHQVNELQQMRNTVYELELTHRKVKESYEEEINRLKLEISQRDHQISSISTYQPQDNKSQQQQQGQPPQIQQQQQQQTIPQYGAPPPQPTSTTFSAIRGDATHLPKLNAMQTSHENSLPTVAAAASAAAGDQKDYGQPTQLPSVSIQNKGASS
ncbi:hypothetical protein Kpol_325p11 [Vanderwaltozyma polyspora DSM 70294]|uniref:Transcriptional repressor Tup1 N-terminal domain-containing protein n=1 Tax=Vanderwaltozyma polyspora (strain ATCC 22028 / DSM 70294 / BCRC 21397 / CBS 2163 / NBRC 10782 / NRRL Y-8283 / UCD 57-17) TaxID=436907 RepID=A7TSU4_VANPO|nr:uncharacterized protein Kpol_325p11 [Vanderwaltozyma polyspora DSM 70294]EDO14672.1 hypothetical protein Kpol_325p11 [Vanderwaltozyma polyspora DSM 70294]